METIKLDGTRLCLRDEAMEALGQALSLPEWRGRNLDALHDCLTELGQPIRLELENRKAMEASPFGQRLLQVLKASADENPYLELTLH